MRAILEHDVGGRHHSLFDLHCLRVVVRKLNQSFVKTIFEETLEKIDRFSQHEKLYQCEATCLKPEI